MKVLLMLLYININFNFIYLSGIEVTPSRNSVTLSKINCNNFELIPAKLHDPSFSQLMLQNPSKYLRVPRNSPSEHEQRRYFIRFFLHRRPHRVRLQKASIVRKQRSGYSKQSRWKIHSVNAREKRERERERERERFIMCAHRNKHIHARMSVKDANEREVNGDS